MTLTMRESSYNAIEKRAAAKRMTVAEYLRRSIDATEQYRLLKSGKG